MQLSALYEDCCEGDTHVHANQWKLSATEEKGFTDAVASMVERVWKEKGLPEGDIDKPVVAEFAKRLWAGVEKGYGKKLTEVDFSSPDNEMLAALQKNVWQFSAAKNFQQLRALTDALIGDDGKLRSYKDFKLAAFKINDQHINQWLQTEYDLAVSGSQMAAKWVNITAQADILPLLEFDAVIDGRTSDLCRSLNKTTLPIDDPFWNTYYPPNHFNCRSTVWQLQKGKITPTDKIPSADIPPMFQVNLAEKKLVFPPKHAYYEGLPTIVKKEAEAMVIDPNYKTRIQGKKGGYVDIHEKTDANKMKQHIEASKILADKGNQVKLLPEINAKDTVSREMFYPGLTTKKCPDASFNGVLGDYKIPDSEIITYKIATRCVTTAGKKGVSICAISLLDEKYNYKLKDVLNGIKGALKNPKDNESIKEVWLILKDKSVLKIPRGIINNKKFYNIAEVL